jgi:predicted HTH transcriptional regulator
MAKSKYTWEDLLNFINQPNNPEIEFKSSLIESKELAQLMVSFANSNGGTLILGFNKVNVQLTGFPHDKEWILTASKRDCAPSLNIGLSEIIRGDKKVFILDIPEGDDKPYKVNNISYVRSEEKQELVAATPEMEKEMNPFGINGLNARQREAMGYIQRNGKITNKDFRELNQVSHKTAHIELTELVTRGVLKTAGAGRSTCYILSSTEISPEVLNDNSEITEESEASLDHEAVKENVESTPFSLAQETFEFKSPSDSHTEEVIQSLTSPKEVSPYEQTELEPFALSFDDIQQAKQEAILFPKD